MKKVEQRTDASLRMPPIIYGEIALGIDAEIRALFGSPRHPRVRERFDNIDQAIAAGRKCLATAILAHRAASEDRRSSDIAKEWRDLERTFDRAMRSYRSAINGLLPPVGYKPNTGKVRADSIAQKSLEFVRRTNFEPSSLEPWMIENPISDMLRDSVPIELRASLSRYASHSVVMGFTALSDLHDIAVKRRRNAAKQAKNDGHPGKRAFVERFAEFWCFLSGKLPKAESGPFLRLLRSAWVDAGGEITKNEGMFSSIVKAVRAELEGAPPTLELEYRPHWLGEYKPPR
ncbi:MAG: hypothetical protein QM744_04130 [Mesorhizobium sp.]